MADLRPGVLCYFCGEPIRDPNSQYNWRRIQGFDRKRDDGGTNAVALREETGELAHDRCVTMERSGVSAGQTTLDDDR